MNILISYEEVTSITESYINTCIRNAVNHSQLHEENFVERAYAALDLWHLICSTTNTPQLTVEKDCARLVSLMWPEPILANSIIQRK